MGVGGSNPAGLPIICVPLPAVRTQPSTQRHCVTAVCYRKNKNKYCSQISAQFHRLRYPRFPTKSETITHLTGHSRTEGRPNTVGFRWER